MSKNLKEKDKLGKFYTFEVTEDRLKTVEKLSRKNLIKHFRNAFILGFCVELMIIKTRIYENIVRSSTMKRLDSKKKEDDNLKERRLLQIKKLQQESTPDFAPK